MKSIEGVLIQSIKNVLIWILLGQLICETGHMLAGRIHGYVWTESAAFTESSHQITNPNRGFYLIYGFAPSDDEQELKGKVTKKLENDQYAIAQIQINLRNYVDRPISEQGLQYIRDLFFELREQGKQYVIRFLYDWNGKNEETEPKNVEIILNHMRQLEEIFREYEDIIFVHQGIFIGNWGEMNRTKYLDNMQELALQLAAVTGEKSYLAVRMPVQWRKITEVEGLTKDVLMKSSLARRLSLFNDGIMGNESDYGTYGKNSESEVGWYGLWNRTEELAFQEELCKWVPNGGEVIIENVWNDFDNAVTTLATMHITYLNRDYDRNVLNKWSQSNVTEEGCFQGMDGLTYMERHLGYRILIKETEMEYDFWADELEVEIQMQNVGFAPLYKEPESRLILWSKTKGEIRNVPMNANLRSMAGGTEAEQILTITERIPIADLEPGEYEIFYSIKDVDSGWNIELANEQEMQEQGYKLGEFKVDVMPDMTELRRQYYMPENFLKPLMGEKR